MNTQQHFEHSVAGEIRHFIEQRKSLMLSTLDRHGAPYASYAPFAVDGDHLYVLLSEIAVHGENLQFNPRAAVLLIEDESQTQDLFARVRVFYRVEAELVPFDSDAWDLGISVLAKRHGDRILSLSQFSDFKLFRLTVNSGRYVKGFARAYALHGHSLAGEQVIHLQADHQKRGAA